MKKKPITTKKELIYSVARGYSVYKKGERFNTVYQSADKAMYKNKAEVKEKYNIGGRLLHIRAYTNNIDNIYKRRK